MTRRLVGEQLVRRFGKREVVRGVELYVAPGEVVGLLGPNGAGKTTCFALLAGLLRPHGGRVVLDGTDVTAMALHLRARLGLGYLLQEPSVFQGLSVLENVSVVLEASGGRTRQQVRARADSWLEELGLTELAGQPARLLSGGERRRLEIARALALEPRYMLLDEPFAGIDPIGLADVMRWVGELTRRGIGVLLTDHNVRECLRICDRAYLLHDGGILTEGSPEHLIQDEVVRRVYLGTGFQCL